MLPLVDRVTVVLMQIPVLIFVNAIVVGPVYFAILFRNQTVLILFRSVIILNAFVHSVDWVLSVRLNLIRVKEFNVKIMAHV